MILSAPLPLAAAVAVVAAILPGGSPRRLAGVGAVLVALAAAFVTVPLGLVPLLDVRARADAAGIAPQAIVVSGVLAAVGLFLVAAGAVEAVRRPRPADAPAASTPRPMRAMLLALAALLAPSLWSLTAVLVATALFSGAWPARLRALLPVVPLVTVAGFACTVGGVWDVALTRIGDVPFSAAAQVAGAIPLLLAAAGWTAAAPMHGFLGFVGPLLLVRVGVPAFDAGLAQWAPLFWPALLALLAWAAWRRDGRLAMQAGLLAGAAAASAEWRFWIIGASVAVAAAPVLPAAPVGRRLARAAGAGMLVALAPAAMRVQLVWTLAMASAALAVLVRCTAERRSAAPSAPR